MGDRLSKIAIITASSKLYRFLILLLIISTIQVIAKVTAVIPTKIPKYWPLKFVAVGTKISLNNLIE